MFTTHFKMARQPFLERAPLDQVQKDERIAQGLARLTYLAQEGTLGVLTGPSGAGKSTLLSLFLHGLPSNRFRPIYLYLTRVSATSLLKMIVTELGDEPRRGKDRLFLQIRERTKTPDLTTLLVIDEAHLLDPGVLLDLRLLISSALDKAPPLKILLAGQDALRHTLKLNTYADLANRISIRFHIRPFNPDETAAYIDHQMRAAGASDKVFDPEVKSRIHDFAHGLPRLINNLATACLLQAEAQNAQKISEPLLEQVLVEFKLP